MTTIKGRARAHESTNAIERMYITMRHLFNRGFYKPMGVSGETLRKSLLQLRPEIYGAIAEEKTEINGLVYILDRLPEGIEQCRYINLTSNEGYKKSHFKPIIPPKRRRNCYRIDKEQMNIEITRGRSDIYDILTHLTFMFIESGKIYQRIFTEDTQQTIRDWQKLEMAIQKKKLSLLEKEEAIIHTAAILGRTFDETLEACKIFATQAQPERFLNIIYWLGKLAIEEEVENKKRTITFSPILRERLGHHIHGEIWANTIKRTLKGHGLLERPLHIISANMHSVMNSIYAGRVLKDTFRKPNNNLSVYEALSKPENEALRNKVRTFAEENGMTGLKDSSGTNIDVQIFDTAKIDLDNLPYQLQGTPKSKEKPVILVMDYAFGEQAYETIDELLKPYKEDDGSMHHLNVVSLSIMGKAGILKGKKGDIMIPTAHIFEGTADNYPFKNELTSADFKDYGLPVYEGSMFTVLGTSLQNRDILEFFYKSTWNTIGIEMEGAHYQKAIQSASRIRKSISEQVKVRYAYYASDNPLETGSTLASGGLGITGVKPTYVITKKILEQVFNS